MRISPRLLQQALAASRPAPTLKKMAEWPIIGSAHLFPKDAQTNPYNVNPCV